MQKQCNHDWDRYYDTTNQSKWICTKCYKVVISDRNPSEHFSVMPILLIFVAFVCFVAFCAL